MIYNNTVQWFEGKTKQFTMWGAFHYQNILYIFDQNPFLLKEIHQKFVKNPFILKGLVWFAFWKRKMPLVTISGTLKFVFFPKMQVQKLAKYLDGLPWGKVYNNRPWLQSQTNAFSMCLCFQCNSTCRRAPLKAKDFWPVWSYVTENVESSRQQLEWRNLFIFSGKVQLIIKTRVKGVPEKIIERIYSKRNSAMQNCGQGLRHGPMVQWSRGSGR